jgi:hypothetical protein
VPRPNRASLGPGDNVQGEPEPRTNRLGNTCVLGTASSQSLKDSSRSFRGTFRTAWVRVVGPLAVVSEGSVYRLISSGDWSSSIKRVGVLKGEEGPIFSTIESTWFLILCARRRIRHTRHNALTATSTSPACHASYIELVCRTLPFPPQNQRISSLQADRKSIQLNPLARQPLHRYMEMANIHIG